jgi:hypothetical protein
MSTGDDQSGCPPFISELVRIRQDPTTVRQARRWAGSKELAEDGLQEAFYILATFRNPAQIINIPAYFWTVLRREIGRQQSQLVPLDPEALAAAPAVLRDVSELAAWHICCERRLVRFTEIRAELLAVIPASSPDPARYRELIVSVVHRTLREAFYGCLSKSEMNAELRSGYPEWLDPGGCPATTRDKRMSRARQHLMLALITIDPDWEVTL